MAAFRTAALVALGPSITVATAIDGPAVARAVRVADGLLAKAGRASCLVIGQPNEEEGSYGPCARSGRAFRGASSAPIGRGAKARPTRRGSIEEAVVIPGPLTASGAEAIGRLRPVTGTAGQAPCCTRRATTDGDGPGARRQRATKGTPAAALPVSRVALASTRTPFAYGPAVTSSQGINDRPTTGVIAAAGFIISLALVGQGSA